MADFRSSAVGIDRSSFDSGLRVYMQRIFNYMGGGLVLTGLVAFIVAHSALAGLVYGTGFRWVAMFAPLIFLMYMNFDAQKASASKLKTLFWVFCGLMGLSMGAIFLYFTNASIARAFFISAATFAGTSLYGYTTKRDLTSMGAFMFMGMLGIFIASIVNAIILHSSMLMWVTSIAGVVIFTGITAYQVQGIKQTYAESSGVEANDKLAVFSALNLYLSFINLFQYILTLTGNSRNN